MLSIIRHSVILFLLLLAPCSLLLAQDIVPHRDIQKVDSLNRGKPEMVPVTVIKDGYVPITRDDGRSYWAHLGRYIQDSLAAYVSDRDWLKVQSNTIPGVTDTMYHNGHVTIGDTNAYTGMLNVIGRLDLRFGEVGDYNIMIGRESGEPAMTGNLNIGIGNRALFRVTTGNNNVAVGNLAGSTISTGNRNFAMGSATLVSNSTGSDNVAVGANALNTYEGSRGTALGANALQYLYDGSDNVAIGYSSGNGASSGINNVFIGSSSAATTDGSSNVMIGYQSGRLNEGSSNIFIGSESGENETGSNKLYIDPTNTSLPLLHGDFTSNTLMINGKLGFVNPGSIATTLIGRDASNYLVPVGYGPEFTLYDNELRFSGGGGSDSVYTTDTTICVIELGDTTCVLRDSTYFVGDSLLCYIYAGDTTCVEYSTMGATLYTGDGHITDGARFVDMDPGTDVYFRHYEYGSGFAYNLSFYPDGNSRFTEIKQNTVSQLAKTLSLRNDNTGNILLHFDGDGSGENYTMGVDKVANRFSIAEGTDIGASAGIPYIDLYGVGDSIVMQQDVQLDALLLDEDGDAPTPGDVLTGTATGVDWAAPSGGGGAISALTDATAANDIDNLAWQQDWRWDILGAGSGLKLTANTTAASGGTQKLLDVRLSGANASSGQTTIAGYFSNLHTHGTNCTNYAVWGETSTTTSNAVGVYGKGSTGVYGDGGSTGVGVKGVTTSIIGVDASATDGIATQTTATTGTGLEVGVTTGLPMDVYDVTAATNTVERMVIYTHATSGTAAAGLGQSHDYYIEASDGDTYLANSLISKWTTATAGSQTSQCIIAGVNSATTQDLATLAGSGQLTLNQYTTSNFNGGTSSDSVMVISSAGVVKKRNASAFGGSSSPPAPSSISPSQLTGDQDNYAPTGIGKATYVYLSSDSGMRAITGIADSVAGTLRKTIFNIGSYPLYLPPSHPDSDAAHRFLTPSSGDFIVQPGHSVDILYDITNTGWRIIGNSNSATNKGPSYDWSAGSGTAGDYGDIALGAIGSGTNTPTASSTSMPAHWLFGTSTNAAWGAYIYAAKTVVTYSAYASAHQYAETLVSIPTLSDGTETFTSELQITETPTSSSMEPNNTIGIRYSHGINSGKWELFSQDNAGAESVADLGITVATNTLYKLRIEVDKSKTEARAYINDVYVGRVTGSMPNSVVCGARTLLIKSAGTTSRNLRVHTFSAGSIYP